MRIAYCTAVFPRLSEKFLLREIACMRSRGVEVIVWALERFTGNVEDVPVVYRPARASAAALQSLGWLLVNHPLRLAVLLEEACRLALRAPRAAAKLLANLHTIAFFARQADDDSVAAVHGCYLNLPGLVAMGVSILTGLPLTVAGHGRDVFVDNRAVRSLARRANWIVLCHTSAADELAGRLDHTLRSKLIVLHHGLDPIEWMNLNNVPTGDNPDGPLIVAAGRFVSKKGFDVLLRAAACIRHDGARVRLALAGDGPQAKALRSLCDRSGLNDCVTWPGWLNEASLRRLLSRSAVVVVPCVIDSDGDRDGIPNIVLEAWSLRVPVVASALPSLCEAISDGIHGLLVPPGDDRQLAEAIQRVLGDEDLRCRLIDGGWRRLRADFDPKTNGRRLLNLFAGVHPGGA